MAFSFNFLLVLLDEIYTTGTATQRDANVMDTYYILSLHEQMCCPGPNRDDITYGSRAKLWYI